jgi:hypothetical protein
MSYCRWSTVLADNYESDLYIYDHVDGFISVNIAGGRWDGIQNAPRLVLSRFVLSEQGKTDEFVASYMARNKWREEQEAAGTLKAVPIDLPYAGESKAFTDPAECVKFLEELKALGYRMPESVLDVSIYERKT